MIYAYTKQIDDYMLPCLNKKLLGMECTGCGMQRSLSLLIKGEFIEAFFMYPGIYSLIALFSVILINSFKKIKYGNKIISILAVLNVILIVGSFLLKLI